MALLLSLPLLRRSALRSGTRNIARTPPAGIAALDTRTAAAADAGGAGFEPALQGLVLVLAPQATGVTAGAGRHAKHALFSVAIYPP